MLPLAHVGLGRRIVSRWSSGLPFWALLLGMLLPDLIDKPTYWIVCRITGTHGLDAGLISGTRTFGHTLLLMGLFALAARRFQSAPLRAIALGIASHLPLDFLSDLCRLVFYDGPVAPLQYLVSQSLVTFFWPLLGFRFPGSGPRTSVQDYVDLSFNPTNLYWEAIGAAIIAVDLLRWWRRRNAP